jgi:PKD repeat protein
MEYLIKTPKLLSGHAITVSRSDDESAYSSIMGTLLIIALTMIMGGIVFLMVNSQPLPEKVPIAYLGISQSSEGIELINKAGDTLTSKSITILVDGVDKTSEFRAQENSPGWGTLKAGDRIYFKSTKTPESVSIVYAGNSGRYLLASTGPGITASVTTVPSSVTGTTATDESASSSQVDAQVVSSTIPSSMNANQSYPVSVTMKNTGSMTWDEANMIRLGGVGESSGDAAKFGPVRINIPAGIKVLPGAQYTFNFTITAPSTPGNYTPQYMMLWEMHQWFGEQVSQLVPVGIRAPQVQFTADTVHGQTPLTVQFTDQSSTGDQTSYAWDFNNDGSTDSTVKNPSFTYLHAGNYTVKLTVTNTTGSAGEIKTNYITVSPGINTPPTAQFTADTTQGKSPLTVQFTDQSTGTPPLTYQWDFSDDIGSTVQNPLWNFWTEKTYTVTLTVTNPYGSDTLVKQNYITVGSISQKSPVASFTVSSSSGVAPLTVQFTDQSCSDGQTSYAWDFNNDGSTDSTVKNPSFTYLNAGDYTVKLTVTNASGSNSEIKTNYITVLSPGIITPQRTGRIIPSSPTAQFTADSTQGKSPLTVQFTDTSVTAGTTSYQWDFNDDGVVDSSAKNPQYTYQRTGSYTVKLTVTDASGSDSEVKTNYIRVVSTFGTTSASLPTAQFTADRTQGLSPLTVQFTDTSVSAGTTTYQWDVNNDGIVDYTLKNPQYTYQKAGNYTVKLTVTNASGSDSEVKTNYIRVSPAVTPTRTPVPTPTITPVPTQTPVIQSGECFGAACNPTGNPIGGGAGYTRIISETDSGVKYVVSTRDQLLTALKSAKSGEVIFVKGTAVIDLTGSSPLTIPAGVTLASDRGRAGSSGALIKKSRGAQNVGWAEPTFTAAGNNVRVTGIRLEGEMYPSTSSPVVPESQYLVGIYSKDHTGLEVDNCEIRGWAWAGVYASNANTPGANGVYVHHNYIHYSLARGEGYGVQIDGANVIIEANIFDNNRHSIAAAGISGEGYEARYNIHLGHGTGIGFATFDIHASGGNVYKMHHNTFETSSIYCIGIQSSGAKKTYIDHNIFKTLYGNRPVFQYGKGNLFVTNNYCNGALYSGESIVDYY